MNAVAICSYHGGALHVLCPEMGTVTHTAEPFPSGIPMQEHRCVLEAFENPETPNRPTRTAREVREKHADGARTPCRTPIAPESEELEVEPLGLPLFLMHSSVVNGAEIPTLIASVTQRYSSDPLRLPAATHQTPRLLSGLPARPPIIDLEINPADHRQRDLFHDTRTTLSCAHFYA
ncbi:hypothetical protein B0H13DRAFT_1887044 [Mycena leptocephala]|nr:hypothetical protein B0H13DRAFT_1887044 [Mycena leptocephala]